LDFTGLIYGNRSVDAPWGLGFVRVMECPQMAMKNFFYQECPVCGRHLRIRVEHLGRELACTHCQGNFIARDPEIPPAPPAQVETSQADSLSFPGLDLGAPTSIGLPR
jgi:hypothetical protein